jgi:hypothetical protein
MWNQKKKLIIPKNKIKILDKLMTKLLKKIKTKKINPTSKNSNN